MNPYTLVAQLAGGRAKLILLALVTSFVAQGLNYFSHHILSLPTTGFAGIRSVRLFLFAVATICLASPLVETLVMVPIMAVLGRLHYKRYISLCITSAAVWAILHATYAVGWAFSAFWLFLIFSIVYHSTQEKSGAVAAYRKTALLHFLNNLFVLSENMLIYYAIGPKEW